MVKRPQRGMPYVLCVDEDLEFRGSDPQLLRAFAGAVRQEGWRILLLGLDSEADTALGTHTVARGGRWGARAALPGAEASQTCTATRER
jgi:hypothetical protein